MASAQWMRGDALASVGGDDVASRQTAELGMDVSAVLSGEQRVQPLFCLIENEHMPPASASEVHTARALVEFGIETRPKGGLGQPPKGKGASLTIRYKLPR